MLYVENYLFQFFFFLSYFYLLRQQWLWPLASIALVLYLYIYLYINIFRQLLGQVQQRTWFIADDFRDNTGNLVHAIKLTLEITELC
jgi:hypothetical protein